MGNYGRETIHGILFDIFLMEYCIWNHDSDTLTSDADKRHLHHDMLLDLCKCWSFLAARKSENLENTYFENLNHLQNLEHFSQTAPCILEGYYHYK